MKMMFVDESKKQGRGYTKEAFVMAGVVIDSEDLIKVENLLEDLKIRYGINKLEDIKKILVKEARLAFTVELRDILFDNNCYVLSAIYGEIALDNFKKIEEVYPACFQFLLERFFMNLNMKNEQGIMFHDEFGKPYGQKFIKSSYKEIKSGEFSCSWNKKKTPFRERIHSQIFFGRDDYSNILQAADVIASTLNYSYIKLKPKLEKLHMIKENIPMMKEENEYLKIYWDIFVKKPRTEDPSGYGIKIWI
jgi:hypothetical protein